MNTREAITTFVAFGVSLVVSLGVAALVSPVFAASQGNLPNPVTGGFSPQTAGALLGMGLLLTTLTFAFGVILTAEMLTVKAGNAKGALEILALLGLLTVVLLLVVADGPLIAISFLLGLPFATALSSKIPVQSKKQKQDRWTQS